MDGRKAAVAQAGATSSAGRAEGGLGSCSFDEGKTPPSTPKTRGAVDVVRQGVSGMSYFLALCLASCHGRWNSGASKMLGAMGTYFSVGTPPIERADDYPIGSQWAKKKLSSESLCIFRGPDFLCRPPLLTFLRTGYSI